MKKGNFRTIKVTPITHNIAKNLSSLRGKSIDSTLNEILTSPQLNIPDRVMQKRREEEMRTRRKLG